MMKNLNKIAVLIACAVTTGVLASDNRAPVVITHGPLTYSFEKLHKKGLNLNLWSIISTKDANKSFLKHGTKTHPLTSLIFNADSFKISDALTAAAVKTPTEKMNALLGSSRIYPRVTYKEQAMNLGGRIDYPVYKDKGRIGLRLNVPIKHVRMERDNQAEVSAAGVQKDMIIGDEVNVKPLPTKDTAGTTDWKNNASGINVVSNMYKLGLVENLPFYDASTWTNAVVYESAKTKILGKEHNKDHDAAFANSKFDTDIIFGVVYHKNDNVPPYNKGKAVALTMGAATSPTFALNWAIATGADVKTAIVDAGAAASASLYNNSTGNVFSAVYPIANLTNLPTTGTGYDEGKIYGFNAADYSGLDATIKDHLWLVSIRNLNKEQVNDDKITRLNGLIQRYASQPVEEWLFMNGCQLQTNEITGLGDSDLDLFYEHTFCDKWIGELNLGLKLPTGNNSARKYSGNPYRAQLGNASHWELKVGGLIEWDALSWMSTRLDAAYSFALKKSEQRMAAFTGATVKNLGPRADADVDWSYFVGNFNLQFRHPKYNKLSSLIGYQLYYKTEDHISFKNSTMNIEWLGKKLNTPTDYVTGILNNSLARQNTQSIGHRVTFEGNWSPKQYLDLFVGGAYTFAGKNIPRETDMHMGVNVKF